MKRYFRWILFCCVGFLAGFVFPVAVLADMGPKPSVVLDFENMEEGRTFYVTLLSKTDSTGPYSVLGKFGDHESYEGDSEEAYAAYRAFVGYEDPDGFYFLQYQTPCVGNDTFTWGYHPPQTFKILLYFPDNKTFAVSEIYEKYAFHSYYAVHMDRDVLALTAEKNYDFTAEVVSLAVRIIVTIILEVGVALLFRYRTRLHLTIILLTNVLTQLLLNGILFWIDYQNGFWSFITAYILFEILVFALEAGLYACLFRHYYRKKHLYVGHPVLYALTANVVSLVVGLWLAKLIPSLF